MYHKAIKESVRCRKNNTSPANVIFAAFCKVRYPCEPHYMLTLLVIYESDILHLKKYLDTKYFMRKKPNPQSGVDCVI